MKLSALLLFTLCFQLFALSAPAAPNVLFIAVDDMNDWIGCLDTTPGAITPHIDRLASQGVNFTNAHTARESIAPPHVPLSSPVAMPPPPVAIRRPSTTLSILTSPRFK